jgi:hypothetical protein
MNPMSLTPNLLIQLHMLLHVTAALNLSLWLMIQLVV